MKLNEEKPKPGNLPDDAEATALLPIDQAIGGGGQPSRVGRSRRRRTVVNQYALLELVSDGGQASIYKAGIDRPENL